MNDKVELMPFWLMPIEQMTPEAVAIMCDADRRPSNAMDTIIVRVGS